MVARKGKEAEDAPPSAADAEPVDPSAALLQLLGQVRDGEHDALIAALEGRRRRVSWERLPSKVVFLRHGQSEGNAEPMMYTHKGDAFLELSPHGYQQAKEAGSRLKEVVGDGRIFVCLSPFERTQQTYLAACDGGFPANQVGVIHVDPQIREQEFGNFQDPGLTSKVRAEEQKVGRFYYRRPNGESSADVFDRVNQFWDKLVSDGNDALILGRRESYQTCLVVTHGLTIRLLLMRVFDWSVETFETVWNLGNSHHVTLQKNMETLTYELCPELSFPARIPWATREIYVVFKSMQASEKTEGDLERVKQLLDSEHGCLADCLRVEKAVEKLLAQRMRERSKPYTVMDYLAIPRPPTMMTKEVLSRVAEGHCLKGTPEELLSKVSAVPMDDLECIDWWGDRISCHGKMMRCHTDGAGDEPHWSIYNQRKSKLDNRMAGFSVA